MIQTLYGLISGKRYIPFQIENYIVIALTVNSYLGLNTLHDAILTKLTYTRAGL